MKRYKLKRDIPAFKAGEVFYLSDAGNLFRESDNVPVYGWTIIDKNPSTLTDWFEEIKESNRWKPETGQEYCYLGSDGSVMNDEWVGLSIDCDRFEIGNCFQTKEEAEQAVEYLKALAVVRGNATSKFIKGIDNWSVHYYAPHNCLDVSDNSYCIRNGTFGLPYFATREDAQRSIERHKNEWLTIFGVKEEVCD